MRLEDHAMASVPAPDASTLEKTASKAEGIQPTLLASLQVARGTLDMSMQYSNKIQVLAAALLDNATRHGNYSASASGTHVK